MALPYWRLSVALLLLVTLSRGSHGELVHFYNFDEDTHDFTLDSGNGEPLDGAKSGRLTAIEGRTQRSADHALFFGGGFVEFDEYDFTDNFTLAAWVQPTADRDDIYTILSNIGRQNMRSGGFLFHVNTWQGTRLGNLVFEVRSEDDQRAHAYTPGNIVTLDGETWQHVAITVDRVNRRVEFYHNGKPLRRGVQRFIRDDFVTAQDNWRIGSTVSGRSNLPFLGGMDDVAIWNETLTPEQMSSVYLFGAPDYNRLLGDFDGDGTLGVGDIDLLMGEVQAKANRSGFDVTGDGLVDGLDLVSFVTDENTLHTYIGDANLDGEFSSGDLVTVFAAGEYEDGINHNSRWSSGDWNADGEFSSGDLVFAFQDGGYEQGPRGSINAVPEPSTSLLMLVGVCLAWRRLKVSTRHRITA